MRRADVRLVALSLALLAPGAPASALEIGSEFATGYDTNAGNAGSSDDERGVASLSAGVHATREHRFGLFTAVQLHGNLAAEQVFDLDDLSGVRAAARLTLLHKPGKGFYTPILAAWASAGARETGSAIRDSYDYRGGLSVTELVTTAVQLRAEGTWSKRVSDGRSFDLDGISYGLSADWNVNSMTVYGGVRQDDGEFVVSAQGHGQIVPKSEHAYLEAKADVIEADETFGADWWAFRVDGRTLITNVGVNVPLTGNLALDVQLQRGGAQVGDYSYDRWLAGVSLLMRL